MLLSRDSLTGRPSATALYRAFSHDLQRFFDIPPKGGSKNGQAPPPGKWYSSGNLFKDSRPTHGASRQQQTFLSDQLNSNLAMAENISNNALILALLSLNGEIAIQKDYLDSGEIPEDEVADEEEVLDDLEQAFMEFVDVYKARAKADETLPSLEELLAGDA